MSLPTLPTLPTLPILACPGKHRVSDNRSWYIPLGKTSRECTYCEECYTTFIKGTPVDVGYTKSNTVYSCCCDYPKDMSKFGLHKNDIQVTIIDSMTYKVYPKLENDMANLNGVMHIILPTCTEYIICIENLNTNKDIYFTFEYGKLGNKEININHGQRIYYKTELEIKGFKTGTNDSFMFMSHSTQDKSEGKTLEGENVTNIISLKIKKWRRTEVYYRSRGATKGYSGDRGDRGAAKGMYFDSDSEPLNASLECYNSLSGGATVSGGSYVDSIRTTSTDDIFNPLDEPIEFLIQLVCNQSETEKYEANKKYYLKKDLEAREALLSKKKVIDNTIKKLEEKLSYDKLELEKLNVELKKYDHLGSVDKESYLVHF